MRGIVSFFVFYCRKEKYFCLLIFFILKHIKFSMQGPKQIDIIYTFDQT